MKPNAYAIALGSDDKPFLFKIKAVGEDLLVIPEKDRQYVENTISVKKSDVVAYLGLKPHPGKVLGCDTTNLFIKTIEHDFWGPINFFVRQDKDTMKSLRESLDRTGSRLTKLGLAKVTENLVTDIRAKQGKYAGMYRHNRDGRNVIWYAPIWAESAELLDYVVYHEFGHAVRHNAVTNLSIRGQWQKLYQRSIKPTVVDKKTVREILDTILESEDRLPEVLKDFVKDDDEKVLQVKAILRWIKQIHKIGTKELDLLKQVDTQTLISVWPDRQVDTNLLAPIVSDYSTVNVEELFAESFAFYCMRKTLPERVTSLLEKTLSVAKNELNA